MNNNRLIALAKGEAKGMDSNDKGSSVSSDLLVLDSWDSFDKAASPLHAAAASERDSHNVSIGRGKAGCSNGSPGACGSLGSGAPLGFPAGPSSSGLVLGAPSPGSLLGLSGLRSSAPSLSKLIPPTIILEDASYSKIGHVSVRKEGTPPIRSLKETCKEF